MERFAQILKAMDTGDGLELAEAEDADTLAIVAAMQEARGAEATDPDAALESGMRKVDQILHADRKAEAPEEDL